MSYDEMDDYERELFEEMHEDELKPEDVFKMTQINRAKMCKVHVEIHDEDGDQVDTAEIVEQILGYMKDKMSMDAENNDFADRILPLMTEALTSGLGRLVGIRGTAFLLSNEMVQHAMVHMMAMGMLLLKFIQQNDLKIYTDEEEVTEEEIDELRRRAKVNNVATMGAMMGMDPKEIIQEMYSKGHISKDELTDLIGEDDDESENN